MNNVNGNEPTVNTPAKSRLSKYGQKSDLDSGRFLLELYQKASLLSEKQLNDYFLDHAVTITGSTIGFFHFVSDDQKSIILTAWNGEALKGCTANYETHYPIDLAGNWVDCVRSGHPTIYNDFAKSPNQKGVPEGHVPISRFMSIPIIENGKVKVVFGVGNKTEPYREDDVVQLQLIANELAKIYKQRQTEITLRESEKKYRSLFENMLDGFALCRMIFDEQNKPVDFVYLEINTAFERLTGLKREAVVGKKVTLAIPGIEKANPELFEIYGKVAFTGVEEKFEVFFKPLGKWFSISVYSPQKGYFVAVFEDITERKEVEASLRVSEVKFRTVANFTYDWEYWISPDGNLLYVSPSCKRITGYEADEFIKDPKLLTRIVYPEDKALIDFHFELVTSEELHGADFRIVTRGGEVRWISHACQAVFDDDGKWLGRRASNRDITERKKAEEELLEGEKRLNRSQEIAHLGSWELDLVENRLSWSDEVYRMFGLKPQEFGATYEAFLEAVHPDDRKAVDAAYSGSLREGRDTYEIEHRVVRKSTGEIRIVYEKCQHVRDENGKIVRSIGMVQDITDRKMMEAKLEEYSKHLESLVEERTKQLKDAERLAAIGATAGMVGHDIRNPLQAITSDVYLAKSDLALTPESEEKRNMQESLDEIEKNVSYINKIVADLQDFARPIKPKIEETELEQTIESVIARLNVPGNVTLKHSVRKDFPKLKTDEAYLQRILTNLANNAIQAMPNGGKLVIDAFTKNGKAVITVEDNGEGIPENVRSKLFMPLVTTKSKGQGFGLSVVKRFTEGLGGTVTFESDVGKGTKFTIELPFDSAKNVS